MWAFWLFVVAMVLGTLYGLFMHAAALLIAPVGLVLSWLLLVFYILPVALVVRWLDLYEREPRSMVLGAFFWGGLVAIVFSGFSNDFWGVFITKVMGAEFASEWSAALTAPIVEETYKYLGIIVLYLIARLEFDDLLDGFVYGALVGLGFSVFEDIFYFIFVFGGDPIGVIQGFIVRVLASGLYGHVMFTGIAGIGLAYFVTRKHDTTLLRRFAVAAGLFLLAVAAHFFWNSPLFGELDLLMYGLVKGMPFFICLVILVYLARRREHVALTEVLEPELGRGGVTARELTMLRDRRARRATTRELVAKAGVHADWALRQLRREQVKLALISSGVESADDARLLQQRAVTRALRGRLLTAPGAPEALGYTAEEAAAEVQATTTFTPDRMVAPSGAWAWTLPDLADRHRLALPGSLPLKTVEQRGDWVLVRSRDNWHGWTGATYLVPFTGSPAPSSPSSAA
jgi:RsiW-degrading membrane proteinase PrsW (M82 family)